MPIASPHSLSWAGSLSFSAILIFLWVKGIHISDHRHLEAFEFHQDAHFNEHIDFHTCCEALISFALRICHWVEVYFFKIIATKEEVKEIFRCCHLRCHLCWSMWLGTNRSISEIRRPGYTKHIFVLFQFWVTFIGFIIGKFQFRTSVVCDLEPKKLSDSWRSSKLSQTRVIFSGTTLCYFGNLPCEFST